MTDDLKDLIARARRHATLEDDDHTVCDDLADALEEQSRQIDMLRTGDTCARQCEGTAYRIEARQQKRRADELLSACEHVIEDNGHLADGENCTLIDLKRAIARAKDGAA